MSSLALLKAVTAGRSRQVRLLLDAGLCNVDCADECGQTPLIRAIFIDMEFSRNTIVRMLLRQGATVSKRDVVGRDALAWACLYGREINVEQLLDNADGELDLNRPDINGQTPLFHAVTSGSASTVKSMVEVLLKYGLSVDVQDVFGTSPLMLATRLNHDVCESILIRNGKAKVGLGITYPEDFNRAEKWAVQTMRNRQKVNRSKFSANVSFSERNRMLRPGQRNNVVNGQVVKLQLLPNSDSETDSSDSDESEVLSSYTSGTETEDMLYCMKFAPKMSIPPSILAVSPSLSTTANASSGDEVDAYSTPYSHRKQDKNKKCLSQLYGLVQDQMTTSYRLTANPPPPSNSPSPSLKLLASERSDVSNRSTMRGRKGTDKNPKLRNLVSKHQTTLGLFGATPRGTPLLDSRDCPLPLQRGTTFPLLSDRRTDLVNIGDKKPEENSRTGNNNYSCM